MSRRSRWEPKPLLDENPWSLVPSVGLSARAGWLMQVGLVTVAILVYVSVERTLGQLAFAWFCSAWSFRYLTQRLGGREAQFGVSRVSSESSFQERLLMDIAVLAAFAISALALFFGVDGWRSFLAAL